MLIELGVMRRRHQAVLEVTGGLPVTEVARRYGVTRQTVHRRLRRWPSQGKSLRHSADGVDARVAREVCAAETMELGGVT